MSLHCVNKPNQQKWCCKILVTRVQQLVWHFRRLGTQAPVTTQQQRSFFHTDSESAALFLLLHWADIWWGNSVQLLNTDHPPCCLTLHMWDQWHDGGDVECLCEREVVYCTCESCVNVYIWMHKIWLCLHECIMCVGNCLQYSMSQCIA